MGSPFCLDKCLVSDIVRDAIGERLALFLLVSLSGYAVPTPLSL